MTFKKYRIPLVNPPVSLEKRYGALSVAGGIEPPLGLCYLASVLRKNGHDTFILDTQALRSDIAESTAKIIAFKPEIIGITATTCQIDSAAALAKKIKKSLPDIPILIGGVHITSIPVETMRRYPEFDIGVIREGEETLLQLLDAISGATDISTVNGIVYRMNNEIIKTDPRKFIPDIDSLPQPAFDLLPYLPKHYRLPSQSIYRTPSISISTSRGCSKQCSFCDRSVFGNLSRPHGAEYIIKTLQTLRYEYGIKNIMFEDDNFLQLKNRVRRLCELLIEHKIDISWSCTSCVDNITKDLLSIMKQAGCWQILFGVESGSQAILNSLKKDIDLNQIKSAVELCREFGIFSKGFIMIGSPGETIDTLLSTKKLLTDLKFDDISVTYLTPFPGTAIKENIEEYGEFQDDWTKMTCFEPVFVPKNLTKEILTSYMKQLYLSFYLRPRILFSYIKRIRNIKVLYAYILALFDLILFIFKKPAKDHRI